MEKQLPCLLETNYYFHFCDTIDLDSKIFSRNILINFVAVSFLFDDEINFFTIFLLLQ